MLSNALQRRLEDYKQWREALVDHLRSYQAWIEQQGLGSGEDDLKIYELIDALKSDKLTIALVGEFSRGKTELINAIFFADLKRRLLPSDAGRTTMCPTELYYDPNLPPCIRLLPVETRTMPQTIAELKRTPPYWATLPLDLEDPEKMGQTFREVVKTKTVSPHEAEGLGLYDPRAADAANNLDAKGQVTIPIWRHALINYPHPLLKQGLVVLDTPGLNALGAEPELTLSMLPGAQAVLFVLAADAGVTQSDLRVWQEHVVPSRRGKGCLAALNKIDTLWDDLRGEFGLASTLARQVDATAHTLGIDKSQVFPVSAQKGLLAKIKGDATLLKKSALPELERKLSNDIVRDKHAIMRDKIVRDISGIIDATRSMVEARLTGALAQLNELKGLGGKSRDVIQQMLTRISEERRAYDRKLDSFQVARRVLAEQGNVLFESLSMGQFDALIARTRQDMQESWTTHGLKAGMKTFFAGAAATMEKVATQANRLKTLVESVYEKFHTEHSLARIRPAPFSLLPYRLALQRLQEEADAFRESPAMLMTEQHFVIKKFFISLVSRARNIFSECNEASRAWNKAIMTPVFTQIREHKTLLDKRTENLKRVHENLDNLNERIAELESTRLDLENQLKVTENMLRKVQEPLLPAEAG